MQQFEYFVMDGRARFNTERAAVFEALGRNPPSNKKLRREWGDMDAVLVRAPVISDGACGEFEYLKDI
ncbi:hypothetical protein [Pluralibacter gergoviae]|uniref:hypothetical protein n=1 Tax=Pluralibacter gergoviae TaxID=61647 RepID=UPI001FF4325F|nr:hypothetical protein [Pluralibacter gergoviae]MCK1065035.1 hypothetical protein [Pluralibacter gergoviae]